MAVGLYSNPGSTPFLAPVKASTASLGQGAESSAVQPDAAPDAFSAAPVASPSAQRQQWFQQVRTILATSPLGQKDLAFLDHSGICVAFDQTGKSSAALFTHGKGPGLAANPKVHLDPTASPYTAAISLSHELTHARNFLSGRTVDATEASRAEYIANCSEDEASAYTHEGLVARELLYRTSGPARDEVAQVPCLAGYFFANYGIPIHQSVPDDILRSDASLSPTQVHASALKLLENERDTHAADSAKEGAEIWDRANGAAPAPQSASVG